MGVRQNERQSLGAERETEIKHRRGVRNWRQNEGQRLKMERQKENRGRTEEATSFVSHSGLEEVNLFERRNVDKKKKTEATRAHELSLEVKHGLLIVEACESTLLKGKTEGQYFLYRSLQLQELPERTYKLGIFDMNSCHGSRTTIEYWGRNELKVIREQRKIFRRIQAPRQRADFEPSTTTASKHSVAEKERAGAAE